MRSTTLLTIAIAAIAPLAFAQDETAAGAQQAAPSTQAATSHEPDVEPATPRPSIKVLQHPYDLASFYRAGGSAPGGWAGLKDNPSYGIASFYRSQGGQPSRYGWSAFWTSGYSAPRPAPFLGYRRTIGENGDLFLMVPYLAPVGPITGAFFGY